MSQRNALKHLAIFFVLLVPLSLSARTWERVMIPDAVCGSGLPYSVFISKQDKDPHKLAVEFMGGGACWSLATCYGTQISTWMFPIPKVPRYSVLSSEDPAKSPVADHTMIYIPYCTGDAFGGRHSASYYGIRANYHGARNVDLTFKHLVSQGLIDPVQYEELFVGGSSAGGIGSLFHINLFESLFPNATKKTMLVDSPGLHWNEQFWLKFSDQMHADFAMTFAKAGLIFDKEDGMVAAQIKDYCLDHPQWKIGFLQASRDSAMTSWFGDIEPDEFERNVLSDHGILAMTRDTPNCSSWVHRSGNHMYYVTPFIFNSRAEGVSAVDYAFQISKGMTLKNYRDRSLVEAYPNL